MDDIRRIERLRYMNKNRWETVLKIFNFLKKNWIKIIIISILLTIFMFPEFSGNIIGKWFNEIANAIIKNIQF
jgi:hypothetical protein